MTACGRLPTSRRVADVAASLCFPTSAAAIRLLTLRRNNIRADDEAATGF